ncbi:hypothetical protein BpHYR1_033471 [Brachionus plicatilis]|uniref:Uncharacterized protein n=1 Tax=Brachionus plicatilis TaxID=10195 RepID=A0A3M7STX9_BRAPC|nr:hypothetical protein BpHYR1_033471 [Brachionus plicatilis]
MAGWMCRSRMSLDSESSNAGRLIDWRVARRRFGYDLMIWCSVFDGVIASFGGVLVRGLGGTVC